jgi:hypothetical protein
MNLSTSKNITRKVSDELRYFILDDGEGYFGSNISAFVTERRQVAKTSNVVTATATRVLNIILQSHYKHQTVNAV